MAGTSVIPPGMPRTVAIDVRMLHHAGIGTYIRNLVPRVMALRPDWRFTLLAPRGTPPAWEGAGNARVVVCDSDIYTVREQLELPRQVPGDAHLLWSPHYNIPLLTRRPVVVTVHDICHLAMPDLYGGVLRQLYARRMLGAVRRRAREIIFVSAFTKDEFINRVGAPRRSTTIHNGVAPEWRAPRSPKPLHERPYLLFIGSAKPHKNLGTLLDAFERILTRVEHDLVIVGNRDRQRTVDSAALDRAARLGARVKLVENAADETVDAYVRNATALILPSLYEGFGLPAAEAMAAGCPCIVSSAASLPEVCGAAALYFEPRDAGDLARQITRLIGEPELRGRLAAAGRERAIRFDWDVAAASTVEVLDRAMHIES